MFGLGQKLWPNHLHVGWTSGKHQPQKLWKQQHLEGYLETYVPLQHLKLFLANKKII